MILGDERCNKLKRLTEKNAKKKKIIFKKEFNNVILSRQAKILSSSKETMQKVNCPASVRISREKFSWTDSDKKSWRFDIPKFRQILRWHCNVLKYLICIAKRPKIINFTALLLDKTYYRYSDCLLCTFLCIRSLDKNGQDFMNVQYIQYLDLVDISVTIDSICRLKYVV